MSSDSVFSAEECVVCMNAPTTMVFTPCRHKCSCINCCDLILARQMKCPLCRGAIEKASKHGSATPATPAQLVEFAQTREAYIEKLHRPVAKNAGYLGKSKLARSVASTIGNELELRQLETAGTERYANAGKAVFTEDTDRQQLVIDYKVGRRKLREIAPLIKDWKDVKLTLWAMLDGEVIDEMAFPTFYPSVFWLWKWHNKTMEDLNGLVGSSKRRRRRK